MIRLAFLLTLIVSPAAAQTGFTALAPAFWPQGPAPDPITLLEPLYRNHPERMEGRPTLRINMRRDAPTRMVVDVELGGLLDDSIEARAFRATVEKGERGWTVVGIGTRHRCAREFTRRWTTRPCT